MILKKRNIKLNEEDKRFINNFDMEPAKEDELAGWNGYVDPEGRFYRTKPIGMPYYKGSYNLHRDWADAYMLSIGYEQGDLPTEVKIEENTEHIYGCQDWLVYGEGWASCTFDSVFVGVTILQKGYVGQYLTKKQKETLFKLFTVNDLPMETYYAQCEDIDIKVNDHEINL